MHRDRHWLWTLVLAAALGSAPLAACGDDDDDDDTHAGEHDHDASAGEVDAGGDGDGDGDGDSDDEIEIAGEWTGEFGDETITSDTWTSFDEVAIVEFDNDDNYAITQNPDDAEFDPEKFNKIVWTEVDDDAFYYCTVAFGLDTAQEAADSTQTGDSDDLEGEGCGGFPWTALERVQ